MKNTMTIRTHKSNDSDVYVAYTYIPTIGYQPYGMLHASARTRIEAIINLLNLLNN